jgi:hypothetical protein
MFEFLKKPLVKQGQRKLENGHHYIESDLPVNSTVQELVEDHLGCELENCEVKDIGNGNQRFKNPINKKVIEVKRGKSQAKSLWNPNLAHTGVHHGEPEGEDERKSPREYPYKNPELVEKLINSLDIGEI